MAGVHSLWRLRGFLRPYVGSLAVMLVAALSGVALAIAIPLVTKAMIDGPIAHHEVGPVLPLGLLAIGLGCLEAFFIWLRRWVQSDGSSRLTFRAPDSFAVLGRQEVRREGRPVRRLNELEVVGRDVWANVWQSDDLLRIDLATGRVTAVVDASALGPHPRPDSDAVLNGIAHRAGDAASRLWVTGKRWPSMYVVEVR